ncbi:hypothetical protein GCM10023069_21430 [Shinella granuli]|uniref:Propionyl-coenzyme A carboxylase alpha polypeptide n=1 Tax=Shinella granuli TaxID=323621 RepID=A0A4R2C4Q0_SHIGR|nr:hypothetical protein EV665_13316 [Shinella granuli]
MYSVFLSLEFAAALPPSALPGISPSRGEIGWGAASPITGLALEQCTDLLPISPLEGEMPGRPEGGAATRSNGDFPC